jgi:cell division protein YceG involved in septum cleavage
MKRAHSCAGCLARLMFALVLVAALAAGVVYYSVSRPYQGFQKPVVLDFPKGTSTESMSALLARAGVIQNSCAPRRACWPANISSQNRRPC